jgi:hypothetical protein
MFARRVRLSTSADETPERRSDRNGDRPKQSSDPRTMTVRILERIAGELFKLPR